MLDSHARGNSFRTFVFAVLSGSVLGLCIPALVVAETVLPLDAFRSLTLRNGGHVILKYGSTHRVTLLEGSTTYTEATVDDDGRLVIDRCASKCPRGYELTVEVVTPEIDGIAVMDGGRIRTSGSFPRQAELAVAVDNGGMIDLRSMTVEDVTASVQQGGGILTKPRRTLVAGVAHGGGITYWGNPRVTRSVQDGGFVAPGAATDADKPLEEIGHGIRPLQPVPPVPPVPSTSRSRRTQ